MLNAVNIETVDFDHDYEKVIYTNIVFLVGKHRSQHAKRDGWFR